MYTDSADLSPSLPGAAVRILVVDDDPALLRLSICILSPRFEVLIAHNGREALSIIQGHGVDLVITDLVMPEMEGLELIRLLHDQNPSLPIIAMSGALCGQYLEVALKFGAQMTVFKPFSAVNLINAVERVLQRETP